MSKAHSLAAVGYCVGKALRSFISGDLRDAVYQIAPAIDVTAKKRYPTIRRVGPRTKAFLLDEQTLIYYLSTQGRYSLPERIKIMLVDSKTDKPVGDSPEHNGELADFIYHNIRCAQSHDGEIDYEYIDFGRNFGVGRITFKDDGEPPKPGLFVVSRATVLALILSVVCAPENAKLQLPGDIDLFGKIVLQKNLLAGNRNYLMRCLRRLFDAEGVGA